MRLSMRYAIMHRLPMATVCARYLISVYTSIKTVLDETQFSEYPESNQISLSKLCNPLPQQTKKKQRYCDSHVDNGCQPFRHRQAHCHGQDYGPW